MGRLNIGGLSLQSDALLAPMEGVSDIGFRALCYHNGAGMTWTEMVRASGIVRRNKATLDLIDTYDPLTPTGVQLFAVNERELAIALYNLDHLAATTHPHFKNIRAIDLNFGCPSPDIIGIGAGPALLKRTNKMNTMFDKLAHWRKTTALDIGAIGAKIRLGLNAQEQEHKVYLRLVEPANQHLDYLAVHARNAKQRSGSLPSWDAIREVKDLATIPVIGNGNVFSYADAQRMHSQTRCDGVMVARGAIDNPWVFREMAGIGSAKPTTDEIRAAQAEYLRVAGEYGTKEKFIAFHEENFGRMLAGARMMVPKNTHM